MTIAALTSPALGKAALTHHASQPAAASMTPDELALGADFGALLRGQVTDAVAPEAASDVPAVATDTVESKRDVSADEGPNPASPDVAALLTAPLATLVAATPMLAAPMAAVVVAPTTEVGQSSESIDLTAAGRIAAVWRGGESVAGIAADGKSLPLLPVAIAGLDDVTASDARAAHGADVDTSAQVRPDLLVSAPVPKPADVPVTLAVEPEVGAAGWNGALGQKVLWMATQHQQVAEMHLNPPNLGPLEVRLTIINDQATAQFVSHHPAVREALESALPRLREMLAESGITLGNVQVGAESFAQGRAFDQGANGSARQGVLPTVELSEPSPGRAGLLALPPRGMVDTFA